MNLSSLTLRTNTTTTNKGDIEDEDSVGENKPMDEELEGERIEEDDPREEPLVEYEPEKDPKEEEDLN